MPEQMFTSNRKTIINFTSMLFMNIVHLNVQVKISFFLGNHTLLPACWMEVIPKVVCLAFLCNGCDSDLTNKHYCIYQACAFNICLFAKIFSPCRLLFFSTSLRCRDCQQPAENKCIANKHNQIGQIGWNGSLYNLCRSFIQNISKSCSSIVVLSDSVILDVCKGYWYRDVCLFTWHATNYCECAKRLVICLISVSQILLYKGF